MLSLDARILKVLRASQGHLTAVELAAQTGSDSANLAARLAELRGAGYEIEEHPHLGFRLISAPDRLIADDLSAMLDGCELVREILVLKETGSTNDVVAEMARKGAGEGLVVFAETQTAGRGRLGRKWESASHEGLWFSVLLRPQFSLALWARLTTGAAVAVAEGIEAVIPCRAMIKWPNDIFIEGKKVVGILIESHMDKGGFAVVGIGVNVNQNDFPDPISQTAASLRQVAGHAIERQRVAVSILTLLAASYAKLASTFSEIVAEAGARSYLQGRWVEASFGNEVVGGIAEQLDENGALQLRRPDGGLVTLSGGEVTLRPPLFPSVAESGKHPA